MHHDHEASGQYDNDRWTWMQNEIQRISTEQQRQDVEIKQNNQMLLRMMQHFNLQGPLYEPQ